MSGFFSLKIPSDPTRQWWNKRSESTKVYLIGVMLWPLLGWLGAFIVAGVIGFFKGLDRGLRGSK